MQQYVTERIAKKTAGRTESRREAGEETKAYN
jgi:hypothetical protein